MLYQHNDHSYFGIINVGCRPIIDVSNIIHFNGSEYGWYPGIIRQGRRGNVTAKMVRQNARHLSRKGLPGSLTLFNSWRLHSHLSRRSLDLSRSLWCVAQRSQLRSSPQRRITVRNAHQDMQDAAAAFSHCKSQFGETRYRPRLYNQLTKACNHQWVVRRKLTSVSHFLFSEIVGTH